MFCSRTVYFISGILFTSIVLTACTSKQTLFKRIYSSQSGIDFNNKIVENDSINPIDLEFLYNGGGVAVGDFNNDGLPDLYFTASTTSNKLYLNKGGFSFEDITEKAHVTGEGRWCNAASVVDINNDGLKDIYVCTTIKKNPAERTNLLYINQGLDNNHVPVFKEMAAAYNLADTSYSVHAAFFDYDNDGDLDIYLATTILAGRTASQFFNSGTSNENSNADIDKLFRNDWSDSLKHPVFTDISAQAGITDHGFALGLSIADINKDGWKDIYVTNDFYSSDHLYINNHDGTFTNKRDDYLRHTTQNAMGNDIADINNDGLADIIAVDMNPEDNYRKKKNMGHMSYYIYQNMLNGKYALQYVRNTLQLNRGPRMNENDSIGDPVFSDIGFMAGVAETDWSWSPLIADFDNDGYRDILITNGYPRDVTDHDFGAFRSQSGTVATKQQLIDEIPIIKIPNYAYKNTGHLHFENVTGNWGMMEPSFSYGAAYVDLDNDGDLDYVTNNINDEAFLYENTLRKDTVATNYLQVKFNGSEQNRNGLGAIAEVHMGDQVLPYENFPWRGYLSTVNDIAYFGLGAAKQIDSLVITWPGGKKQVLQQVQANQLLTVDIKNAGTSPGAMAPAIMTTNLFTDITRSTNIHYKHQEIDYIDFDVQRLLPHKFSQYGPSLAAADVNGDGLDDIFIGGNSIAEPTLLLQQSNGTFTETQLPVPAGVYKSETMGMLLLDVDGDGDLDLYCASGSNEYTANTKNYQDRLYVNKGEGEFIVDTAALPVNYTSKSCVKAADYDKDGDLDLFIGGRVLPGRYPLPVSSFIYRNDSKDGVARFTDVTSQVAGSLQNIGLVCDATWTDFDNDGYPDLLLAGEWMPLTFLHNVKGTFQNITAGTGLENSTGWWNSITAGDFDNDGDMDYIAGNLGQNSFYRTSASYPVQLYAKDFDANEGYDAIPTVYLKDEKGVLKEFTAQNRDEVVEQLPGLKKKALTYKVFGSTGFHDLLSAEQLKGVQVLKASNFKSCYIKNNGNGKFELIPLPEQAQLAPVYGMVVDDFNNDGNLDVALAANDYGTEVTNGRYDAADGLVLMGNGKGNFSAQTIVQSGLYIPGDAKALVKLKGKSDSYFIASSRNKEFLKLFHLKTGGIIIPLQGDETSAYIHLKNGSVRKEERYYGTSFLSQSSRFLSLTSSILSIDVTTSKGSNRSIHNK
jgi:enediyne biosynthesis protein E4